MARKSVALVPELHHENGWSEYKNLVLTTIDDLKADIKEIKEEMTKSKIELKVDITKLMSKNGVISAVASFLAAAAPILIYLVFKH